LKHSRELFWRYWLPLLAMLTLIKLESSDMMSGAHTASHLKDLLLCAGVRPGEGQLDLLNAVLRKSGHLVAYGLLCFCWLRLLRGAYWLQHDLRDQLDFTKYTIQVRRLWWRLEWGGLAVLFTFVVAASDELHQMSIPSRTGCWSDVALDTSAAVAIAVCVWARAAWISRGERTPRARILLGRGKGERSEEIFSSAL
jgi:uncharacterized membrane protein